MFKGRINSQRARTARRRVLQVGLLAIIGLSTKNAILIIEFAKDLVAQGRDVVSATLEAVRLRLRPIIMTSMAFVLGVVPLAIARGAGSASQQAIGTGVAGGMLSAIFLAIFLMPVFFVAVMRIFKKKESAGFDPEQSLNVKTHDE